MHIHTPTLNAVDPRGLAVRTVAYHRRATSAPPESRVTHQLYDGAGRLARQRDPRLFALLDAPSNLSSTYSLTSQPLCSDSVDAGWQVDLPGAAGQVIESWDQRGWHRRTEHDSSLRPVAMFEQGIGEVERCAERIRWGAATDEEARHNRCGQPIRQDDPAGSRLLSDSGMSAAVLLEIRHFLNSFDPPDWPLVEAERDLLLEPGEGARASWSFLPSGELSHQTDAKGHTRHFTYDRAGQLHSVGLQRSGQSTADTLVNAIEYNAFGQIEQERAGNGMRTSSSYDPANGRLTNLDTQGPVQGYLQKLSYGYDPAGNITEIADAALPIQYFANQRIEPVRRFAYDTLYQLISATGWETAKPSLGPALPEWQGFGPPDGSRWCRYTETYHYDEAGNLLQRLHHGAVDDTLIMRVASHSNRSVKDRAGQPAIDELFDARGNLLELQPGQALQWNGRNQLAQVTQVARIEGADDIERYVYDSEGARLRKYREVTAKSIVHTPEVRYLPGIELHANSATGERLQVISVQAGRCTVRLLHWDSPPPAGLDNDQWRYCFDDHLGSSAFEVDAQAKTISQEVYYPFGGTAWLAGRHEVETSYKTIRYSGKERDATGLYYYGARYYAPWLQRWLNPDPAGDVDGLNFYRFVRNGPDNYVDSQGNFPTPASIFRAWYQLIEYAVDWFDGTHVSSGIELAHEGMDEFRRDKPNLAAELESAFNLAVENLQHAVDVLERGQLNLYIAGANFGDISLQDINYLSRGYRGMILDIESIRSNHERLVFVSGETPVAFVRKTDAARRIYINIDSFFEESIENQSHILGHELTHLSTDFQSEDFWYLSRAQFDSWEEVLGWSRVVMREGVEDGFFHSKAEDVFISRAGMRNVVEAREKFYNSSAFRTRLALHNADTLMNFAELINNSR
ncbi:RHS repeat-associated core domain-containing protein [Pseudomonas sp. UW4]|uniref:RHS repeat-associated core domain-containing protein n=1 Tax=Pseudomonas sp. UW4 TaxID=1207075 RepID=UPI00029D13B6|nr:RHS repeat-associated core domain-containing protein [Pseudomonas sp. UW4]AFY20002.1 YD repeat-containing protein [Pseudomonas sp. UW4]